MASIKLQADGSFPFTFYIEKAVAVEKDGQMVIEGCASTTNVDHDNERFAPDALVSMARIINEKSVPLRIEHQKGDNAVTGRVFEARIDERNQLWVKAILDPAHAASSIVYNSIKQGTKMGLSVGGKVKSAIKEMVESTGKMIKTFYDVELDEVSLTMRPSNYDAWLVTKSIKREDEAVDKFYDTPFYREFLFENPHLDYVRAFAKAVPDKAWKNVGLPEIMNKNNNNDMDKDKDKKDETTKGEDALLQRQPDKKMEDHEVAVKGYATKGEVAELGQLMAKGFDSLVNLIGKMGVEAEDQTQPKKDKPNPEVKSKAADDDKKDDTTKAADETDETKTKAAPANGTDTEGDKEKAMDEDKKDDTTKAGKDDTEHEYEVASTVTRSIKSIDALTKKLEGMKKTPDAETDETKTKAEDDKEEATTKSVKESEIDQFVGAITGFSNALVSKFEKSNIRVPGLERMIVDAVRNDSEVQKSIRDMIKQPGLKKSVAGGVAWFPSKDGRRFALSAKPLEDVQKSVDSAKGKSFKDVYNERFSTLATNEE